MEEPIVDRTGTITLLLQENDQRMAYFDGMMTAFYAPGTLLRGMPPLRDDATFLGVINHEVALTSSLLDSAGLYSVQLPLFKPFNYSNITAGMKVNLVPYVSGTPCRYTPVLYNEASPSHPFLVHTDRQCVYSLRDEDAAIRAINELATEDILGFDTESKPTFRKGAPKSLPSLLQLSTTTSGAFVFSLRGVTEAHRLGQAIVGLMRDEGVLKAGVSVDGDLMDLMRLFPSLATKEGQPRGFVRLETMAELAGVEARGLKSMCMEVLQITMHKAKKVTLSNWSQWPLQPAQVRYAIHDAHAGNLLFHGLLAMIGLSFSEFLTKHGANVCAPLSQTMKRALDSGFLLLSAGGPDASSRPSHASKCVGSRHDRSLYVGNLDRGCVHLKKRLLGMCKEMGLRVAVKSAAVIRDNNGNPKGFGFLEFWSTDDQKTALAGLSGCVFMGRLLVVSPSRK
eukprot:TRINITY_DN226_c3_g1_i1.p1 TRINITY_DN226_c3_g1~~TRINITY_DN226_c3_g1_i1.p1  ORF type:complete len:453 (-),score=56.42 TRINITY_DN226_c3_g1_i1:464-1822(-)